MASRSPSFEFLASSQKPGSATTHRCRSVKRTGSGSTPGCAPIRASPMSSASCQVMPAPSFGNLHHHVAPHHPLAPQPRVQGEALRGVEAILLVLLHRREVPLPLAHHHVAGGARAAAPAVVL